MNKLFILLVVAISVVSFLACESGEELNFDVEMAMAEDVYSLSMDSKLLEADLLLTGEATVTKVAVKIVGCPAGPTENFQIAINGQFMEMSRQVSYKGMTFIGEGQIELPQGDHVIEVLASDLSLRKVGIQCEFVIDSVEFAESVQHDPKLGLSGTALFPVIDGQRKYINIQKTVIEFME